MTQNLRYYFLPSLQRELSAAIPGPSSGSRAAFNIDLTIEAEKPEGGIDEETISKEIQLYGPGDVLGFLPQAVLKTSPQPDVGNAEPHLFTTIEFTTPDFLWRFTANAPDANGQGQLTPWITLIVLIAEGENKEFSENPSPPQGLPPSISIKSWAKLPDLGYAWRWAHVQVISEEVEASEDIKDAIPFILKNDPLRVTSRLMCARSMSPGTLYQAFVVPTFALGRYAGLGLTPPADCDAEEFSWGGDEGAFDLPYYYKWEFRTGMKGDFESLIRLIEPKKLENIGLREMDGSSPGYGLPDMIQGYPSDLGTNSIAIEGALMSPDARYSDWGKDAVVNEGETPPQGEVNPFQLDLQNLLNQPTENLKSPGDIPTIVPPLYGRWHAASETVAADEDANSWFDVLNLDPRHRIAAGLGSLVVRKRQDALMASAWKQLGAVEKANQLLCRAQMGREVSGSLFDRINSLGLWDFLSLVNPTVSQVNMNSAAESEPAATVKKVLKENTNIPLAVFDPAFVRVRRKRGPIGKRMHVEGGDSDILEGLNDEDIVIAGPHPIPHGTISFGGLLEQTGPYSPQSDPEQTDLYPRPGMEFNWKDITCDILNPNLQLGTHRQCIDFNTLAEGDYDAGLVLDGFVIGSVIEEQGFRIIQNPAGERGINIAGADLCIILPGPSSSVQFRFGAIKPTAIPVEAFNSDDEIVVTSGEDQISVSSDRVEHVYSIFGENIVRVCIMGDLILTGICATLVIPSDIIEELLETTCMMIENWLPPSGTEPGVSDPVEPDGIRGILIEALDPEKTIVERTLSRLNLRGVPEQSDPLGTIMAAPEFPQPMYAALRQISEELLVPGVENIPQNSLGLLVTNRRFLEAYMCGLNHEFSAELLWREYPTDQRGSYFRQFWDKRDYVPSSQVIRNIEVETLVELLDSGDGTRQELPVLDHFQGLREDSDSPIENVSLFRSRLEGDDSSRESLDSLRIQAKEAGISPEEVNRIIAKKLTEKLKDIKPIHEWGTEKLADNFVEFLGNTGENIVLVVRGDLLKRFPNTLLYAIEGYSESGEKEDRKPKLVEYLSDTVGAAEPISPLFRGSLPPDIKFYQFPFSLEDAIGNGDSARFPEGIYFVFEERVTENRFGLDVQSGSGTINSWDDLSWSHFNCEENGIGLYINDPLSDVVIQIPGTGATELNWGASSASIATIALQKPVRLAVHAARMIQDAGSD